jgi:hypothetical protein
VINVVRHCFPLTFSEENLCVSRLQGILDVYRYSLHNIELNGPTFFSDIIRTASRIASSTSNSYQILLIITDGRLMICKNY